MKTSSYFGKIALGLLLLCTGACIGNDSPEFLATAFQGLSGEPSEDLIGGWTFTTTVTARGETEVCSYFDDNDDEYEVAVIIAEDGSCTATSEAFDETAVLACDADTDEIVVTVSYAVSSGSCGYKQEDIIKAKLAEDGTFTGERSGLITLSGDCGEDADTGEAVATGTCEYTGSAEPSAAIDDIDSDNDGYSLMEDCDDTDAAINPDAEEILDNAVDENCDNIVATSADDSDNDGFTAAEDCDDLDPDINPDATEVLDNDVDENCDGIVGETSDDGDGDGFIADDDCDDTDADINPEATEVAGNEIDENCDGDTDADFLCDVAANCGDNAIDPDKGRANDWYWVDSEAGDPTLDSTNPVKITPRTFVDGTYDGDEIVVFGVVDGFLDQTHVYTFCNGTYGALVGICVEK